MANTERISVYLTSAEKTALHDAADELGVSENAVIKIILRGALGLPLPTIFRDKLDEIEKVTLQ